MPMFVFVRQLLLMKFLCLSWSLVHGVLHSGSGLVAIVCSQPLIGHAVCKQIILILARVKNLWPAFFTKRYHEAVRMVAPSREDYGLQIESLLKSF